MSVAKETNESFFNILNKSAIEIFTIAMYLQDKVKIIEAKYKQ